MALWYPKWVPGIHAPDGPLFNLGRFNITDPEGKRIAWRRTSIEPYRFTFDVPAGVERIVVDIDYICCQPSANSRGIDSQAGTTIGVVNWNTCLVYPDGYSSDAIRMNLSVRLPDDWHAATALKATASEGDWTNFETASLREIVDSPMICGKHLAEYDLMNIANLPVKLHVVSDDPRVLPILENDQNLLLQYGMIVDEGVRLFGKPPFEEYHFLLVCSSLLEDTGLEHWRSSLNIVGTHDLLTEEKRRGWVAELLPHEFLHAWCGKYRRPAGMATSNYHDPKDLQLLWIYEGLVEYLGQIVTVRCGLHNQQQYREQLARLIHDLRIQQGRSWRSLEDTAVTSYQLRDDSRYWWMLRRSQDYYEEPVLYWMEADTIIREKSNGQKSLDDFCRLFFSCDGVPAVKPYEAQDVYDALGEIAAFDWKSFFEQRVTEPMSELNLELVGRLGYRLEQATSPDGFWTLIEERRSEVNETSTIGLNVSTNGWIKAVVPNSAADKCGLCKAMVIKAVNSETFSAYRLRKAIAESLTGKEIRLLIESEEILRDVVVEYSEGGRYLTLARDVEKPDVLGRILLPASLTTRVRLPRQNR